MHSSSSSQIKDLDVMQLVGQPVFPSQDKEIIELKKSRDDLLQEVQDSFKKVQGLAIALSPYSYPAPDYLDQSESYCVSLESKLDLKTPDYLLNRRIHLLPNSSKEARELFSDKEDEGYLEWVKTKHEEIVEHIRRDVSLCLRKVSSTMKEPKDLKRVLQARLGRGMQENKIYFNRRRCEISLAQELYSSQGFWGLYNPQANYGGHAEILEPGSKRSNHSTRGLDRLRSFEDSFIAKLRNNFKQKDIESLKKKQEYAPDLEAQIEILKKIYAPHREFHQSVNSPFSCRVIPSLMYHPHPDSVQQITLDYYQLIHRQYSLKVGQHLKTIEVHLIKGRYLKDSAKGYLWLSLITLNSSLAKGMPDFDLLSEPYQGELGGRDAMISALQKTRILIKEQVIIYDPRSSSLCECESRLEDIARHNASQTWCERQDAIKSMNKKLDEQTHNLPPPSFNSIDSLDARRAGPSAKLQRTS